MKKLLLIVPLLMISSAHAMLTREQCKDILSELKAGRPYANYDAAKYAALKLSMDEQKIANDPFAKSDVRKNAQRRCQCADFFMSAGQSYTELMEIEALEQDFTEQKKNKPTVTRVESLSGYLQRESAKSNARTTMGLLSILAHTCARSFVFDAQEKALCKQWDATFQEYEKAASSPAPKSEKQASIIDKYLK